MSGRGRVTGSHACPEPALPVEVPERCGCVLSDEWCGQEAALAGKVCTGEPASPDKVSQVLVVTTGPRESLVVVLEVWEVFPIPLGEGRFLATAVGDGDVLVVPSRDLPLLVLGEEKALRAASEEGDFLATAVGGGNAVALIWVVRGILGVFFAGWEDGLMAAVLTALP